MYQKVLFLRRICECIPKFKKNGVNEDKYENNKNAFHTCFITLRCIYKTRLSYVGINMIPY